MQHWPHERAAEFDEVIKQASICRGGTIFASLN